MKRATMWSGAKYFKRRGGVVGVDNARQMQYLATQLTDKYKHLLTNELAIQQWRALLICFVIQQFDLFVWRELVRRDQMKTTCLFQKKVLRTYGANSPPPFCWHVFSRLFIVNGKPGKPYLLHGNRAKYHNALQLIEHLFKPTEPHQSTENEKLPSWKLSPFRQMTQHCLELVEKRLGAKQAQSWLDDLYFTVALTHCMLPAPSKDRGLFTITDKGKKGAGKSSISWFSSVFYNGQEGGEAMRFTGHASEQWDSFEKDLRSKFPDEHVRLLTERCHGTQQSGDLVFLLAVAKSEWAKDLGARTTHIHHQGKDTLCFTASSEQDNVSENQLRWLRGANVVEMGLPPKFTEMNVLKRGSAHVLAWFEARLFAIQEKRERLVPVQVEEEVTIVPWWRVNDK
ncbi:hypothetical protein SEPCBS119000_006736 [Sporothrix epigloea]|uniref:Uncharacterized protein n=1 Tax=Sporothrix epigloea TaxID=1892477 RepID=A0ABP0E4K8_9PEZI